LAAYAGASIAGSNMFQTGLFAFRLGIIAYVVPYMFIFNPAILLIGPWQKILPVVLTAAMGTVSLAAGLEKWFIGKMRIYEVLAFAGGGFLLIVPEWRTDLVGAICIAIGLLSQYVGKGKKIESAVADPSGSYDP
jgi:TRAP-type uncharacterized transport system fused permease subunit